MAEERYPDLVHEIVREIEARLKERRTLAWEEKNSADVMLQCLEEGMIKTLGIIA
jgi:hypothetical protein